jgi:hypothetical protein
MARQAMTERDVVEQARDATEGLGWYITPEDIDADIDEWDDLDPDLLEQEMHRSAEIMAGEWQSPYGGLIHDYTMSMIQDDLMPAPMDHLTFDTYTEAVRNGYFPHKMNYTALRETLEELVDMRHGRHDLNSDDKLWHMHNECYTEARQTVERGIAEGLDPRDE